MNQAWEQIISQKTDAKSIERGEVIQSLWSGYGEIVRYHLTGADVESVIIKHVKFPSNMNHPRGWNNNQSHQRKVTSYEVEMRWYHDWGNRCDNDCRIPHCYASETQNGECLMILEDLDASGFPVRQSQLDLHGIQLCLTWLAHFHATFLNDSPTGLWPMGSYWHLATRPDELAAMNDDALRNAAPKIDAMLNDCQFKTMIHGDAKLANFCFSMDGESVAAVDFQYVGGGCGMKDVAYFLGSCLSDSEHETYESTLLDAYFKALESALIKHEKNIYFVALEKEWRSLFSVAQADFYRFLVGWMPTHWKINHYNQRITQTLLTRLNKG